MEKQIKCKERLSYINIETFEVRVRKVSDEKKQRKKSKQIGRNAEEKM